MYMIHSDNYSKRNLPRWLICLIDLVVDYLLFIFPPTQYTVSFETQSPNLYISGQLNLFCFTICFFVSKIIIHTIQEIALESSISNYKINSLSLPLAVVGRSCEASQVIIVHEL